MADYQAKIAGATKLTEQNFDSIEAAGYRVGNAIRTVGENLASAREKMTLAQEAAEAFVAGLAIEKIADVIKENLEFAASIKETAEQLGVSTDALQVYRFSASQVGVKQEDLDQGLEQLTRRIGEAVGGTKAQAAAFDKLGISVRDAHGNILDTATALPLIADKLRDIADPADRAAVEMDLFGRNGQRLEPLLLQGSAGMDRLRGSAHQLGVVLSEELIENAGQAQHKLEALKEVLQANFASAVANNANSILEMANALTVLVEKASSAVTALRKCKLEVANRQDQMTADGWFTSAADKKAAQARIEGRNNELAVLNGNGSFKGLQKRLYATLNDPFPILLSKVVDCDHKRPHGLRGHGASRAGARRAKATVSGERQRGR